MMCGNLFILYLKPLRIENSKSRIKKARERYNLILENQTIEFCEKYDIADLEDITVACSNEDEYEASPFTTEDVEETAQEITEAIKNGEILSDDIMFIIDKIKEQKKETE